MSAPTVGDPLPNPTLHSPDGPIALHDLLGDGPLLILFYREDATPACTTQLCAFRDEFELLTELGASVVAISADDTQSQQRFREAQKFPFPLLSDPNLDAAQAFNVADPPTHRSHRAAFISNPNAIITLTIPFYQPTNLNHYQSIYQSLGI